MKKYVYPVLSNHDWGIFRIGGPGLANCMFIAARAYVTARLIGGVLLRPSWERFGIGQWVRREPDKRLYAGLFKGAGIIQALRKLFVRLFQRNSTIFVRWDCSYFRGLWGHEAEIRSYFNRIINPNAVSLVPLELTRSVAVHVRLGDFPAHYRTPIAWYKSMMEQVASRLGLLGADFMIFSDGTDSELAPLINVPGARRVFFGNALADMIAMSRCRFLIGSDSTFSTWAAFLGNVPCVFAHLNDCPPFQTADKYAVVSNCDVIPNFLLEKVK